MDLLWVEACRYSRRATIHHEAFNPRTLGGLWGGVGDKQDCNPATFHLRGGESNEVDHGRYDVIRGWWISCWCSVIRAKL